MQNINLAGISFADLPHITNKSRDNFGQLVKGEEAYVVRETGELWDSDARPAYSIRLESMHIGYIPLVETAKEEWMKARDGFKKVWKEEYAEMTPEQLRKVATELNRTGELVSFHDWKHVGTENTKRMLSMLNDRCITIEIVRDFLYSAMFRNHENPRCMIQAVYYDDKHGRNYDEIGDICSVIATFAEIY